MNHLFNKEAPMFLRFLFACCFAISMVFCSTTAFAGQVQLTTYYPSPYGEYQQLKATGVDTNNGTTALQAAGSSGTGLIVTNANNVGIGTTAPNAKLSFGTSVQDNDIYLYDGTSDKYGFGVRSSQFMIYSGAGGASTGGVTLGKFDGTTFTEAMRIRNDGNVGIGTTAPAYKLAVAGTIWANGTLVTAGIATWSDVRLKENIESIGNGLDRIEKLNGVFYDWKQNEFTKNFPKGRQIGLIAQDVEKVVPELVTEGEDGYKKVSYERLTAVLVEAVKEQQQQIDLLKKEIAELKKR